MVGIRGNSYGYALLDVLVAVFLLSLGFASLYALNEGALKETQQAVNLTNSANLAQSLMDQLGANSWQDNLVQGKAIPGETVQGQDGQFAWSIHSEWDTLPNLLRVSVEIRWVERGLERSYRLESMYVTEY